MKNLSKVFIMSVLIALLSCGYALAADVYPEFKDFRISATENSTEIDGGRQFYDGSNMGFTLKVKKDASGKYIIQNLENERETFDLRPFCSQDGKQQVPSAWTKFKAVWTEGFGTGECIYIDGYNGTSQINVLWSNIKVVGTGTVKGYVTIPESSGKTPPTFTNYYYGDMAGTYEFTINIVEEEEEAEKSYAVDIVNKPSDYTEGGDVNIRVRASVTSGTGIQSQPVLVVVGLYDNSERMISYSYVEQTIAPGEERVLAAGFMLPEASAGYEVRVFIWDEWNTPTVLSNKVIIPVTAKP